MRVDTVTICGTDLHILKGDVFTQAYAVFANAAETGALKVVLTR